MEKDKPTAPSPTHATNRGEEKRITLQEFVQKEFSTEKQTSLLGLIADLKDADSEKSVVQIDAWFTTHYGNDPLVEGRAVFTKLRAALDGTMADKFLNGFNHFFQKWKSQSLDPKKMPYKPDALVYFPQMKLNLQELKTTIDDLLIVDDSTDECTITTFFLKKTASTITGQLKNASLLIANSLEAMEAAA
ncbi:MAG: hypothetical protein AAFU03_18100, partial [Bacteroidota bacterium]